jgi:hypothetical protein
MLIAVDDDDVIEETEGAESVGWGNPEVNVTPLVYV